MPKHPHRPDKPARKGPSWATRSPPKRSVPAQNGSPSARHRLPATPKSTSGAVSTSISGAANPQTPEGIRLKRQRMLEAREAEIKRKTNEEATANSETTLVSGSTILASSSTSTAATVTNSNFVPTETAQVAACTSATISLAQSRPTAQPAAAAASPPFPGFTTATALVTVRNFPTASTGNDATSSITPAAGAVPVSPYQAAVEAAAARAKERKEAADRRTTLLQTMGITSRGRRGRRRGFRYQPPPRPNALAVPIISDNEPSTLFGRQKVKLAETVVNTGVKWGTRHIESLAKKTGLSQEEVEAELEGKNDGNVRGRLMIASKILL